MAGIRLEWAQFGDFDSFDVIRSNTSMIGVADAALPSPIATNLKTMYYVDTAIVEGATYYYKIRAYRSGFSTVSDEVKALAALGDEYWSNVAILMLADTSASNLADSAITINQSGTVTLNQAVTPKFCENVFDLTNDFNNLNATIPQLGTQPFTYETWIDSRSPVNSWARFIEIGIENWGDGAFYVCNVQKNYPAKPSMSWAMSGGQQLRDDYFIKDEFNHLCLMRTENGWFLFLNGVLQHRNTTTDAKNYNVVDQRFRLGSSAYSGNRALSAYMDSLRLTIGIARYNETGFVPPVEKFKDYGI